MEDKELQIVMQANKYGIFENIKINDIGFQPIYLVKDSFSIRSAETNRPNKIPQNNYFDLKMIENDDSSGCYKLTYGKGIPDNKTTKGIIFKSFGDFKDKSFELYCYKRMSNQSFKEQK